MIQIRVCFDVSPIHFSSLGPIQDPCRYITSSVRMAAPHNVRTRHLDHRIAQRSPFHPAAEGRLSTVAQRARCETPSAGGWFVAASGLAEAYQKNQEIKKCVKYSIHKKETNSTKGFFLTHNGKKQNTSGVFWQWHGRQWRSWTWSDSSSWSRDTIWSQRKGAVLVFRDVLESKFRLGLVV